MIQTKMWRWFFNRRWVFLRRELLILQIEIENPKEDMALEIEHKFLVEEDSYIEMAVEVREIRQGYLQRDPARTVRIRTVGDRGYVTVKGITVGDTRREYEYEIPLADAREMLAMCLPPVIEKRRYVVPFAGKTWEVDRFGGPLAPLVTAEIELSEPGEHYETPPFVGREVTGDPAYYNSNLLSAPAL